jgi:thioesterase domain-containing protein
MAAHYIEELKAVQPEGPYFLGGWSSGGTIAYEMAQQLIAGGQIVSQLLLLDSMSYRSQKEHIDEDEEDDAALLLSLFSRALAISPEDLDKFQGDERIDYILKKAISLNLLPPDIDVTQVRPFLKVYKANVRAVRQYIPQVYPGTITLFKTTKQAVESQPDGSAAVEPTTKTSQDPTKGWGDVAAGGVRVIYIPGRHTTMLNKPHVETLALRIKTSLSESAAGDDIFEACAN